MKLFKVSLRNADDIEVAYRYFRTREEASAEQSHMLGYDWAGFMAAPIIEATDVPDEAADKLIREEVRA